MNESIISEAQSENKSKIKGNSLRLSRSRKCRKLYQDEVNYQYDVNANERKGG